MNQDAGDSITGLILAGGESSRLGVNSKALEDLHGKSLFQRVLARLGPQVDRIMVSTHQALEDLASFDCEQVVDVVERQRGPLIGLVSGLLRVECRGYGNWLLLSPCDAPFLPADLASRLRVAVGESDGRVAVARYEEVLQPVFSLWHLDVLPVLKQAVMERGRGGLMSVLDALEFVAVDWPVNDPAPFFNVNTPEDLEVAQAMVDARGD